MSTTPNLSYDGIEGLEDLEKALRNVTPVTQDAAMEHVSWEMGIMFDLSQVYIPKDTRAAMESGKKNEPELTMSGFEGSITYGGTNLNPKTGEPTNSYIVALHEDLDMRHLFPTKAKFLEHAVLERMPALEHRTARFVGTKLETQLMLQRLSRLPERRGVR